MLVEEIVTCSREGQSSKAAFGIVITEDGMFICLNELHSEKAAIPIKLTDKGLSNDALLNDVHLLKA